MSNMLQDHLYGWCAPAGAVRCAMDTGREHGPVRPGWCGEPLAPGFRLARDADTGELYPAPIDPADPRTFPGARRGPLTRQQARPVAPHFPGAYLEPMREWLEDCMWRDLDPEDVAALPAAAILRGVARHYAGGLEAFCAEELRAWGAFWATCSGELLPPRVVA